MGMNHAKCNNLKMNVVGSEIEGMEMKAKSVCSCILFNDAFSVTQTMMG
jgi:hypothetical protein